MKRNSRRESALNSVPGIMSGLTSAVTKFAREADPLSIWPEDGLRLGLSPRAVCLGERFEMDRARLVGGLARIGIERGQREQIGRCVVHRNENLPGLNRRCDERRRGKRATPR